MNTSDQINNVVDKLADKIGIIVEKIEPITKEVVEQVQNRGLLQGCLCCVAITFLVIVLFTLNSGNKELSVDAKASRFIAVLILCVTVVIFSICAINSFSTYVAPLASILGV